MPDPDMLHNRWLKKKKQVTHWVKTLATNFKKEMINLRLFVIARKKARILQKLSGN